MNGNEHRARRDNLDCQWKKIPVYQCIDSISVSQRMFVGTPASIGLENGIFSPNSLSSSTTIIYYSSDLLRCWCTGTTHY